MCLQERISRRDGARTFCIGEVSDEKKKLVRVTRECFFAAMEGLKAGTPLYDIGYKVQRHAESNGFSVIRSYTGHGIGREMHEDPAVPNFGRKGTGPRLPANAVICVEPMIAAADGASTSSTTAGRPSWRTNGPLRTMRTPWSSVKTVSKF